MNKYSILVVEDEALIAANLVQILSSLGYTVPEPVATGEDAIRAVKTQHPDLVLMDIKLIGAMDGIKAAEKIRAIADIPIVYLTAYTDNLRLKKAQLTEPYGYIVKPTHSRELHATIEMAMYKHALDLKLKESEDKYRTLIETTGTGFVFIDPDGLVLDANPEYVRLTGHHDLREIVGRSVIEWTADYEKEKNAAAIKTCFAKGSIRNLEIDYVDSKGNITPIEINATCIETGGKTQTITICRDITERKRAEKALQIQHNLALALTTCHTMKEALELILDAAFHDKSLDSGGIYVADPVTGALELVVHRAIPPEFVEHISHFDADAPQVLRAKTGTPFYGPYADIRQPGKDEIRDREGVTALASIPVMHGGDLVAIMNMASHIHADIPVHTRQLLETLAAQISGALVYIRSVEALRESEARLRLSVQSTNIGLWDWDLKTNTVYFSPEWKSQIGYRDDEISDRFDEWQSRVHPDDLESALQKVSAYVANPHGRHDIEFRLRHKDGSYRWINALADIMRDADGKPVRMLGCHLDITNRKRADEALRQANKQLNLLSGITRHDILNQLLVLRGYLELSLDVIDMPEALKEFIKKEQQAANTIDEQITFTRDYQELGAAAPVWQNVNEGIRNAMIALPMRGIHVEPDPANPEVYSDPLFEKVFYNLIDNALRHGGADMKTIRVSSQESDASLTIVCEDDGVGITDEDKKKLFRKGFGKHTGLGLFLSREILSITGITITETGVPGKGARFEITVPKGAYRFTGTGGK